MFRSFKHKKRKVSNVQKLTDHINQADKSGSIKFTYEQESEGSLPFLDTLIVRKADGTIKLQVYRKPTHTDLYLNYQSHHPVHQKLGVVRTLMDRKDHIVTEEEDKINEDKKVEEALKVCGYPTWAFEKVKKQMERGKQKSVAKQKGDGERCKGMVVIPYVKGASERMSRLYKSYNIASAMKHHTTLRRELVHPKDKRDCYNSTHALYNIPCLNCELFFWRCALAHACCLSLLLLSYVNFMVFFCCCYVFNFIPMESS